MYILIKWHFLVLFLSELYENGILYVVYEDLIFFFLLNIVSKIGFVSNYSLIFIDIQYFVVWLYNILLSDT